MFILDCIYVDYKRFYKLDNKLFSYEDVLQKLGLSTLKEHREVLTNKFAITTANNERHKDMFAKRHSHKFASRNMYVIEEPFCNTDRYYKSAIPYMSRILNGVFLSKKS